jgi:hypothetical protein
VTDVRAGQPSDRREETEPRVIGLFKFGQRAHMEELVTEGHVYMRPLSDFMALESDALRSDPAEGSASSIPAENFRLQVKLDGEWKPVGGIVGTVRLRDGRLEKANVYCLYALLDSIESALVDARNLGFGNTYVVFTNGDEFLRRVRAEATRLKLRLEAGLVGYVDESIYHGPMGIFRKYSSFAYQSECRLALLPGSGSPYSLRVGDLSDITVIGELAELNERIRLVKR